MQLGLAGQVAEELDGIVERITELLDAGWRSVRVVTDHGWLLVPGGLPKTDLPGYLVESRWARCAARSPPWKDWGRPTNPTPFKKLLSMPKRPSAGIASMAW